MALRLVSYYSLTLFVHTIRSRYSFTLLDIRSRYSITLCLLPGFGLSCAAEPPSAHLDFYPAPVCLWPVKFVIFCAVHQINVYFGMLPARRDAAAGPFPGFPRTRVVDLFMISPDRFQCFFTQFRGVKPTVAKPGPALCGVGTLLCCGAQYPLGALLNQRVESKGAALPGNAAPEGSLFQVQRRLINVDGVQIVCAA